MAAPKGNKFWECRAKHGRDGIWDKPQDLWNDCVEYFKWVEANPLLEAKSYQYQGAPLQDQIAKMRSMTFEGLYVHLGIAHSTWQEYRKKEDFSAIVERVENVIRDYKLAGAAADLLNPSIIARELGLKDASTNEHTGPNGGPIETKTTFQFIGVDEDHTD